MTNFIFICGGVMSGVGKGTACASIGRILKSKGFRVTAMKIDPYLNVDAGTMNPIEHGEVFVMKDGTECDQDIGHYERFLDEEFDELNYLTSGKVYLSVIEKERALKYGGRCVEIVPDIPNEVIFRIEKLAKERKADFVLVEIGGTVGEYQNLLFLEAARMMRLKYPKNVLLIMVSYLPIPEKVGEMKTKPTQLAVRLLNEAGLQADIILGRSRVPLDEIRRRKISVFCNLRPEDVISAPDTENIYEIPLNLEKDNLGNRILKKLGKKPRPDDLKDWEKIVRNAFLAKKEVKIAIIGKYFESGNFILMDSYISLIEAIKHAAWHLKLKPKIIWVSSEKYEKNKRALKELREVNGVIIPGGFGKRGIEGKILAIEFCRKNKIPFLGICLGMQLAVVEFARNVCGLKRANSTEFEENCQNVIDILPEQKMLLKDEKYGGTMRKGDYDCEIKKGTLAFKIYKKTLIKERHRHRFEVNNDFRGILEKKGLIFSGINPQKNLVEIIEIKNHPFFIGVQFHPEFKTRFLNPHPLFLSFIKKSFKK